MKNRILISLVAAALVAGCSSTPDSDSPLARARVEYSSAQANPQVTSLAPSELRQASDSLDKANAASKKGESRDHVDHLAYVTTQQVAIARETARQKAAEQAVATASTERERVRLDARTREAAELYQKAIANAFREVRDALAAQANLREAHLAQQERERALARTSELTRLRYDNGAVSLFELLESERQLMAARLDAIDAERNRRSAIVDLYLALGA